MPPITVGTLADRLMHLAIWLENADDEVTTLQGASFYICEILREASKVVGDAELITQIYALDKELERRRKEKQNG